MTNYSTLLGNSAVDMAFAVPKAKSRLPNLDLQNFNISYM